MQAIAQSLDGIIDTVSAKHPLGVYLNTLKVGGVCVMLGAPDEPMDLPIFDINLRECTVLPGGDTLHECFSQGSRQHSCHQCHA